METLLTAQQEEWLVRAAFGSRCGVMSAHVVAALAAAGLGEPNVQGSIDINDAGRRYIRDRDLPTAVTVARRRHP
jgi:hypothetical protein